MMSPRLPRSLDDLPVAYRWLREYAHNLSCLEPAHLLRGEQVARTAYGFLILFVTRDFVEKAAVRGSYKNHMVTHFRDRISGRTVQFLDVGGNIGLYTLLCAEFAAPGTTIDVFEPVPSNVARLCKNVELNGYTVDVYACALGSDHEIVELAVTADPGESTLADRSWNEEPVTHSIHTPQTTIDTVYEGRPVPDVIQIDAKGAEAAVIAGMTEILSRARPDLYLVVHPRLVERLGRSVDEIREVLCSAGYTHCYDLEADTDREITALGDATTGAQYLYITDT